MWNFIDIMVRHNNVGDFAASREVKFFLINAIEEQRFNQIDKILKHASYLPNINSLIQKDKLLTATSIMHTTYPYRTRLVYYERFESRFRYALRKRYGDDGAWQIIRYGFPKGGERPAGTRQQSPAYENRSARENEQST